jgi:hypothetical protein
MSVFRLTTLSVLLRHEQFSLTSRSDPQAYRQCTSLSSNVRTNPASQERTSLVASKYGISTQYRQQWILSSLRSFNIHVQKFKREISIAGYETNGTEPDSNKVTFLSYEAIWPLLGYGVHTSWTYGYGSIAPALRVFPVVNSLTTCFDLFKCGTLQMVQQAFRSGVVHPFTKNEGGYTLLHVSCKARESVLN